MNFTIIRSILFGLVAGLASLSTPSFGSTILFERSLSINRSVNIFDTDEFDLDLTLGDQFFSPSNPVTLFDELVIAPDDVGTVVDVLPDDANFGEVAQRLTDASNEFLLFAFTEDQLGGRTEQRGWQESGFFLRPLPTDQPDLAGSTIEQISLRIDQFTLSDVTSTSSVASSLSEPPVNLELTLTIFGVVPEPNSLWLVCSSLVTLIGTRRPRRVRS